MLILKEYTFLIHIYIYYIQYNALDILVCEYTSSEIYNYVNTKNK